MGSEVRKYALILNGDFEMRHLTNVSRSLKTLKEGGFETFVASPVKPEISYDHYITPTLAGIQTLVNGLQSKIDENDQLVIYTTGHGRFENGEGELCFEGGCDYQTIAPLLDGIRYGQRTVIMDQCYGGNWAKIFLDDPKTLFVSAGSRCEPVCCNEFSPRFWGKDVPDLNGDGIVNWQERYAAAPSDKSLGRSQLLFSTGYIQEGQPPFDAKVLEIQSESEFKKALKSLLPGQYAVVMFSASWCEVCKKYRPLFDQLALEAKGQLQFLFTEDETLASRYGVTQYPTIIVFNGQGDSLVVQDRSKVLAAVSEFHLPRKEKTPLYRYYFDDPWTTALLQLVMIPWLRQATPDQVAHLARRLRLKFNHPDLKIRYEALIQYEGLFYYNIKPSEVRRAVATLRKFCLRDADPFVRYKALDIYGGSLKDIPQEELNPWVEITRSHFFNDPEERVRLSAYYRYGDSIARLDPSQVEQEARELRSLFHSSDESLSGYARSAYSDFIVKKLSPAAQRREAARLIISLEKQTGRVEVMENLLSAYISLLKVFARENIPQEFFKLLRLTRHPQSSIRRLAIIGLEKVVVDFRVMPVSEAAKRIRERFMDLDPGVREAALLTYRSFATEKILSPEEVVEGSKALRPLFKDPIIGLFAIDAYERLSELLSLEGKMEVVELLRECFTNAPEKVRIEAMRHYWSLKGKLSLEEILKGAQALRIHFRDPSQEVRLMAVKTYWALAENLLPNEARHRLISVLKDGKLSHPSTSSPGWKSWWKSFVHDHLTPIEKLHLEELREGVKVLKAWGQDSDQQVQDSIAKAKEFILGRLDWWGLEE